MIREPQERLIDYYKKIDQNIAKDIRRGQRPRPNGSGELTDRVPETWEEAHEVHKEIEALNRDAVASATGAAQPSYAAPSSCNWSAPRNGSYSAEGGGWNPNWGQDIPEPKPSLGPAQGSEGDGTEEAQDEVSWWLERLWRGHLRGEVNERAHDCQRCWGDYQQTAPLAKSAGKGKGGKGKNRCDGGGGPNPCGKKGGPGVHGSGGSRCFQGRDRGVCDEPGCPWKHLDRPTGAGRRQPDQPAGPSAKAAGPRKPEGQAPGATGPAGQEQEWQEDAGEGGGATDRAQARMNGRCVSARWTPRTLDRALTAPPAVRSPAIRSL